MLKACCKCICAPVLVIIIIVGLCAIQPVKLALNYEVHKRSDNYGVMLAGFMATTFGDMLSCSPELVKTGKPALMSCMKDYMATNNAAIYGWNPGMAIMINEGPGGLGPLGFGHEGYKQFAYNPKIGRTPNKLSKMDLTEMLHSGMDKLPVNFNTGDPEWIKRRGLIIDSFPALLKEPPSSPQIIVPKGVDDSMWAQEKALRDFVGLNLFNHLFPGADVTSELDAMKFYDDMMGVSLSGGGGKKSVPPGVLEKLENTRIELYNKIKDTESAKTFMSAAEAAGLDPKVQLFTMIWITMFAGYGGTGYTVFEGFNLVKTNPSKMLALFRKDPDNFVLEVSRLKPAVAGMNPLVLTEPLTVKRVDGATTTYPAGTWGGVLSSGANYDASIFPDPHDFRIDRPNHDRMMSFNNEVRDISKCNSTGGLARGCKEAPRPCPGTWLALRLAKAAMEFFMNGIEKSLDKKKTEL